MKLKQTIQMTVKKYFTDNNVNDSKDFNDILSSAKAYVLKNNKSENAYHNNKHIVDVYDNAMMLFDECKKEFTLNEYGRLYLGLAALFHDFGHSGGKLSDSENIKIAVEALEDYLVEIGSPNLFQGAKDILEATEFPHKAIELSSLQKIIRDADTMGGIANGFEDVVKSLAKEYGKSLDEFVPMQIKFIENAKFNTEYCKNLLEKNKHRIIAELKEMSNV